MDNPFYYKNGRLFCESLDINDFAKTVPTPFYLYSKSEIDYNCAMVWEAAGNSKLHPCYALKANYNPTILKIIKDHGFGADIVSEGELYFALKAGFQAEKIVFAGVGKSIKEISDAIRNGVHTINVESPDELSNVALAAKEAGKIQRIAIRINPDIEAKTHEYISTGLHTNKFGISKDQAFQLYIDAQKDPYLVPEGIHVHIGSQITEKSPYLATTVFLKEFLQQLEAQGIHIKFLDLGGGIGINYDNAFDNPQTVRSYIKEILPDYISAFKSLDISLYIELGRSIIGSAGILISQVLIKKKTPLKNFMIIDAAMNNLIRPSLYKAKHPIVPTLQENNTKILADIVGPVCESGDFMAKDYSIDDISTGSFIAIGSAGAYGQALSSNYNLRPTIAEYLVDNDNVKCIFKGISVTDLANNYSW